MKILFIVLILCRMLPACSSEKTVMEQPEQKIEISVTDEARRAYDAIGLAGEVDYDTFEKAFKGYLKVSLRDRDVLTLIDFTRPSTQKRMWVIDMEHHKILYHTHVSHGSGSGGDLPTKFSNVPGSYTSSPGFYLTSGTYHGKNGYSMRIDGLEPGFNDKARERAIVVHASAYSDPSVIARTGRLGRSQGCPALPPSLSRKIIDATKNGSVMYIHVSDPTYLAGSAFLNDDWSDNAYAVNQLGRHGV